MGGYVVFCHFYLSNSKSNMFPKNWSVQKKAHNANLMLTFRHHVDSDGKLSVEIEYFLPRLMWMTMSPHHQANLSHLAERSAKDIASVWDPELPMVSSRMCFSHEMLEQKLAQDVAILQKAGPGVEIQLTSTISVKRTQFFFDSIDLPGTYKLYQQMNNIIPSLQHVEKVGMVRYDGMFHDHELQAIEQACDKVQQDADQGKFKPMTSHNTIFNGECKRTKHFFKARYLWTKEQLAEADADRAGGLRTDVDSIPDWLEFVIDRLVLVGVVPENFINGVALNMYHDGSLGIGLHSDCRSRFDRPIITLRLFSPARLALGGHNLGGNAVCVVDLPRGAVLSMYKDSYAADGVKHNVRSCDMVTKSAALIFRHMWEDCLEEADRIQEDVKPESAGSEGKSNT